MNVLRVMPLRTLSVVFAGAGVVLLLVVAVDALTGGGDGGSLAAVPTSSALGGEASPTPANTGADTEGVPYSLSSLERVWRAAGMTVTTGGTSEGFEGFEGRPLNIKIERDGSEMKFSVFVYSDPQQAGRDWSLASGEVPVPNAASTTPDHVTSWYNTNIVIVVLTDSAALHADALSGVSELTP